MKEADPSSGVNQVKVNGTPGYDGQRGWTTAQLADFLARGFPGTPVVDRTGLNGRYAMEFDFTVERVRLRATRWGRPLRSETGKPQGADRLYRYRSSGAAYPN